MTLPPRFSVCPHDTAKGVDRWALFHTLVNKQLRLGTRFLPSFDFKEFDEDLKQPGCVWGYLNPAQYLTARRLHGGEALVRPVGRPDKVYLVAPTERPLPEGQLAVAAVDGYLFRLFQHALKEGSLREQDGAGLAARLGGGFERKKAKSYAEVMNQTERGDAHVGVTYNEHFDDLSTLVRSKFRVLATVDVGLSHVVVVSQGMPADKKEELRRILLEAAGSPEGQKILEVFGTTGFEPVPLEPYELLVQILG
jgi:phosphonate transport system substrate-binding protein